MLAGVRRQIASINRRLHLLENRGDGTLTEAQLVWLEESNWGKYKGAAILKRARHRDPEAEKIARRRLARIRCSLRAARRRKYRQARKKVDHFWRSAETWIGSSVDAAFVGLIPRSVLGLRDG